MFVQNVPFTTCFVVCIFATMLLHCFAIINVPKLAYTFHSGVCLLCAAQRVFANDMFVGGRFERCSSSALTSLKLRWCACSAYWWTWHFVYSYSVFLWYFSICSVLHEFVDSLRSYFYFTIRRTDWTRSICTTHSLTRCVQSVHKYGKGAHISTSSKPFSTSSTQHHQQPTNTTMRNIINIIVVRDRNRKFRTSLTYCAYSSIFDGVDWMGGSLSVHRRCALQARVAVIYKSFYTLVSRAL